MSENGNFPKISATQLLFLSFLGFATLCEEEKPPVLIFFISCSNLDYNSFILVVVIFLKNCI